MKTLLTALVIAILLTFSSSAPSYGQGGDDFEAPPDFPAQDLRFQHLTTEDGLSQDRVWGITQDHRGFMWFATLEGLNRYDGYEFQVYRQERDNPNSPGGSVFWVSLEDHAGMIWAGSPGGGLSRFDPTTEQWRRYQHDPSDPNSLGSNSVFSILEDSAGVLWVGTEAGLNRFDGETEDGQARFTRFEYDPNDPHSLGSGWLPSIYEDRSGVLWIGTSEGGLNRFDPQTETLTRYQHDPEDPDSLSHNNVFAVQEDRSGVLWVGTYGGGLNRFDPETETFARYQHNPQDPRSLSGDIVTDVLEDPSGTLWIATFDGGLNRYHPESDSFSSYQHNPFDESSLGSNTLGSLFVDQSGILWIGTVGSGISKLDPKRQGFSVTQHNPGDANSLSNNDVRAVLEDRFGDLWIGTFGGLNRYDPETGRYTRYLHDPADSTSLGDDRMHTIVEDNTGVLWVGTDAHGLNRFDRDTETFFQITSDPANPDGLSDNTIIRLYVDREGILWIGTWSAGLDAFDPQSQNGQPRFTHYRHDPEDPHSLGEGFVASIVEDQAGVLWVGTSAGGLCRLERDAEKRQTPGTFFCYKHDPKDADSLGDNTVWAIHEDREGALWLGTSAGLNRLDPQTGKFLHYTTADGLPHESVFGILEDENGYLWLSTARGLSRSDPQAVTFQNYHASDGLQGDVFNQLAYYKASTGELFFGGPNGLTRFYPDDIRQNPYIPPVHITGLQLSNEPVSIGDDSPLQQSILETKRLELPYDERVISFEFAALNYSSPEENRYRYKLEGFDREWIEVGSDRRFATYTNLDPGEYTFTVLGSNNDGVWNEEGASINLVITSPWWGTWWFRGGMLLLLVGLVAGGFVWQRQSAERRKRQLEATVVERTHELGERVKELDCLYGISKLAGQQDLSLERIIRGAVDLLPLALHYPGIACARIILDGREFESHNFRETPWRLSFAIVVRGEQAGQAEIAYLEERPDADEGPFLKEERLLLSAVAERLGRIIERKQAEERLREEIAERRRAERELQAQSSLFESLLEATPDTIEIIDPATMKYIKWNKALTELSGYSDEELASLSSTTSFFDEADLQRIEAAAEQAILEGVAVVAADAILKDGSRLPMEFVVSLARDAEGNPLYLVSVGRDITERKQAEEALRESEAKYRDLVEKISDVIYAVDVGGALTYVNPAAESLLGLPVEQLVGQPFAQFIHPEDLGRAQNNHQALLSGEVIGPAEYRLLTASGQTRWIRVTSQPMTEEGRVAGLQGVLTDITERKMVEEQLENAAITAERQRLARELHDSVTQSLHSANLIADTLPLKWEEDPDEGKRGLQLLQRFTQGALAEMRTLLLELNPKALEIQELRVLLRQLADATMAQTRAIVTTTIAGECTVPTAVKVALYRITQEALNNAVKHAGARLIRVGWQCPEERDGTHILLSIRDDGRGFDPEGTPPTGLGIGIMRDRAREINATLTITSQPGQGTEVLIEWQDMEIKS